MHPEHAPRVPALRAVDIHQPTPLTPAPPTVTASLVPVHPGTVPTPAKSAVSRTAVNIALGGIGFGAVCGGLVLLTTLIAALAALIHQLVILAAVIFGGWIAAQMFSANGRRGGTTVNIRKAVFKRNHFHGQPSIATSH
ncbi:hypothetical protein [Streptomyces sp. NPDC086766]|uniref:hypothetical protein n=1 Tax=Streptomyces sp. NPDC086766 TaxID=3365754 RepID=UPI0038294704